MSIAVSEVSVLPVPWAPSDDPLPALRRDPVTDPRNRHWKRTRVYLQTISRCKLDIASLFS
ncbi:hypothetical protein NEOLEDRAFT_1129263 [Neolentinus lepideus HHB14362 ss-1]|uniref:Uncharacterized protein n=1 Tax=Neolentinus lepideus HHB14362 ss-1 TaxID=1314782 RepID=A0A165UP40_9AGAM|nr:hypothetical protein NEOLEDRAFT_1129263 [Neolentinus lepideus HHB14362 ss-1]